jgi:nicotinamidase-related amidase
MKEKYLSLESAHQTINEMIMDLTHHHYHPKPLKLYPEKAALLVLDMQNYFLDPASHAFTPSAPSIVPNINKLIDFAKKFKMQIIFTRHVNDDKNAGMMEKWWRDHVKDGSWESELYEKRGQGERETGRLYDCKTGSKESPVRDDSMVGRGAKEKWRQGEIKIFVKNQYDAFYHTDLEGYLRSKNLEQVIITGVLTNLCCETTARSAFVRGFGVFFPVDATATYNKEFHLSTFRNLGFGFCPIMTTADLINSFQENE